MKRILFSLFLSIFALGAFAQMSDSQVLSMYQREVKAGTSQGQIVTKLMTLTAELVVGDRSVMSASSKFIITQIY